MKMIDYFILHCKHGQYEQLFDLFSVFILHIFVGVGEWGREHGHESLEPGAIFFYESILKNIFLRNLKMIDFFILAWKHGQ